MEKPNKRDREEDDEDRRPGKRAADEVSDPEDPPRRWRPTPVPTRSQRPDLSYPGAGAEAEQAAPLAEPERGADGEYTRARAIGALAHRRDCERCGWQDYNAELRYIDQLEAREEANKLAWRCPRCLGMRKDLQVQIELRKQQEKETRQAEAYCRAFRAEVRELTRELTTSMRRADRLEREVDILQARLDHDRR
jgi:hypothetical protein